jgi:Protein of unknown function (DUF1214)
MISKQVSATPRASLTRPSNGHSKAGPMRMPITEIGDKTTRIERTLRLAAWLLFHGTKRCTCLLLLPMALTISRRAIAICRRSIAACLRWSLTAYLPQGQSYLVDNLLNRYSIGDRTAGLRRNDDGSFDIWISRQNPGGEKTDNWLPAPESGPYSLYMRAYLPKPELLSGDYRLPPLMPV